MEKDQQKEASQEVCSQFKSMIKRPMELIRKWEFELAQKLIDDLENMVNIYKWLPIASIDKSDKETWYLDMIKDPMEVVEDLKFRLKMKQYLVENNKKIVSINQISEQEEENISQK